MMTLSKKTDSTWSFPASNATRTQPRQDMYASRNIRVHASSAAVCRHVPNRKLSSNRTARSTFQLLPWRAGGRRRLRGGRPPPAEREFVDQRSPSFHLPAVAVGGEGGLQGTRRGNSWKV